MVRRADSRPRGGRTDDIVITCMLRRQGKAFGYREEHVQRPWVDREQEQPGGWCGWKAGRG